MTSAASVAEPAKTAPRAAAAPVEEARQESRAAGARERLSTEEADGGQFFMNIGFE